MVHSFLFEIHRCNTMNVFYFLLIIPTKPSTMVYLPISPSIIIGPRYNSGFLFVIFVIPAAISNTNSVRLLFSFHLSLFRYNFEMRTDLRFYGYRNFIIGVFSLGTIREFQIKTAKVFEIIFFYRLMFCIGNLIRPVTFLFEMFLRPCVG